MVGILYEQDWKRYSRAIVDDRTKNTSWLEIASKYKSMGVRHWYFPLALLRPELRDYNPFDPELPDHIIVMMMMECVENPWYFMREIQRVPAKSGGGSNPLEANRGNIAFFWCMFNSFITYLQQIRQTGKSLNTRALINYFHNVAAEGSQHILFTKGDLRKEEIKEYKKMRDMLPRWMWYIHKKDSDNQHEFTTMSRGNTTKSYVPQGDPVSATSVGRGTTPTLVTIDEPPFLDYAEISIPALIAATTASFDEAMRKGAMHGIAYTTTAGDLSTASGKFVYEKIKKAAMFFSEILFDCKDRNDALALIKSHSKGGAPLVDISFTHLQLGKSDAWLKEKIANTPASRDKIMRDFLGQWTYGSASNPIPEKILNMIRDNINQSPIVVREESDYLVRYHLPIEEIQRRRSVLGLDLSEAINRDAITGVMIDVETSETLMTFSVCEANLVRFASWCLNLFVKFPRMTMIPEAKNSWAAIRDYFLIHLPLLGIDPGRRIYSRVVDTANGTESEKRHYREYSSGVPTERKYYPYRTEFGFPTSGTLRESLTQDVLKIATRQSARLIRDPALIDELSGLVERNGRVDHKASGHDDHVISWLMANWFLRYARNLDHYGIEPGIVLCRLQQAITNDPKELIRNQKQEKLLQEITELENKIQKSQTLMEQRYLEAKLKSLKSEVREEVSKVSQSLDKLSEDNRKAKQNEARTRHSDGIFSHGISRRRF